MPASSLSGEVLDQIKCDDTFPACFTVGGNTYSGDW